MIYAINLSMDHWICWLFFTYAIHFSPNINVLRVPSVQNFNRNIVCLALSCLTTPWRRLTTESECTIDAYLWLRGRSAVLGGSWSEKMTDDCCKHLFRCDHRQRYWKERLNPTILVCTVIPILSMICINWSQWYTIRSS